MSFFSLFKSKNKEENSLDKTDNNSTSSNKISNLITQIFTHKKLDEEILQELEEALITADLGAKFSEKIIDELKKNKFQKSITENEIKEFLAQKITEILKKCEKNLDETLQNYQNSPKTLIFNGVNGSGKTTTIGKIAFNLSNQGKKVLIAACDTFRAGAADQLEVWAKRSNCEIVKAQKEGEDPASIAYKAMKKGKEENFDFLLIDTAGRLQNKQNLMDELKKINNVLKKIDESAPNENILVLDATIGQNAKNQIEIFDKIVGISGLIITKLDGSAKAGVVVGICDEFQKPIYAIGIGEKIQDLQQFDAEKFSKNLLGI